MKESTPKPEDYAIEGMVTDDIHYDSESTIREEDVNGAVEDEPVTKEQ